MNDQATKQYQTRDWDVVDYQMHTIPGWPYGLRGPALPEDVGRYACVLGASQSFGVLTPDPYVHKLSRALGIDFLNLSVGGSAPGLFLRNAAALERCNASSLCIIQILSARSAQSSYFESRGGKNRLRKRGTDDPFVQGDAVYKQMFETEPRAIRRLILGEIRANWTKEMLQLLGAIKVPKVLLWFSKRSPDDRETLQQYKRSVGIFPHFVTRRMIDDIRPYAEAYVEVTTNRGLPNTLINRFTGETAYPKLGNKRVPSAQNTYYPSPEMHEDVFEALRDPVEALWTGAPLTARTVIANPAGGDAPGTGGKTPRKTTPPKTGGNRRKGPKRPPPQNAP